MEVYGEGYQDYSMEYDQREGMLRVIYYSGSGYPVCRLPTKTRNSCFIGQATLKLFTFSVSGAIFSTYVCEE